MSKQNTIIIASLLAVLVAILYLPISNFFLKRERIEVRAGTPEFKAVSHMMQNKCVDCHTPGMMSKPVYASFPFAASLIDDDMEAAQQQIIFTRDHLSGVKPFTKVEAARIQTVVENNEMPIFPYKLMHWDAGLTAADKEAVIAWIQSQYSASNDKSSTTQAE